MDDSTKPQSHYFSEIHKHIGHIGWQMIAWYASCPISTSSACDGTQLAMVAVLKTASDVTANMGYAVYYC